MDTPKVHAMSDGTGARRARFAALAFALGCSAWAAPAAAQVTSDKAAQDIARAYGVQVLQVRPGEVGGKAVWLVTAMTPGGNFNDAFQVNTLAVDRSSGALVPAFRQGPSGATGTAEAPELRGDRRPDAARSGTWR
jgi:hypothetical protein